MESSTVTAESFTWFPDLGIERNSTESYVTGISRVIYIALTPITSLFIIIGNALTIVAVVRHLHMRTLTNYLVSLSCADLLVGVFAPFYVAIQIMVDEEGRAMALTNQAACLGCMWVMQMTMTSSVFNLLAIAFERCVAVYFPLRYASLVTKQRIQITIVTIWTVAISVSMPPVLGWNRWYAVHIEKCFFGKNVIF